jgi:methylthioribose-1-phosphate isomerase
VTNQSETNTVYPGTYALAVHAKHFNIPFFVAAPVTSIDTSMATGDLIPIEQRPPTEITHSFGQQVAASGINVWNPAFDVTPGCLVTGASPAPHTSDSLDANRTRKGFGWE